MPDAERPVDEIEQVLDLEELDTDLYRGTHDRASRFRGDLYGGQVAAQALRAAAHTVPDGRLPNSLHGYFLRPGRNDRPVLLQVSRDRDGRSFSSRHVVAVQAGEVIFSMSSSFQIPREGSEWSSPRTPAAPPEETEEGVGFADMIRTVRLKPLEPAVPYRADEWPVPARMWVTTRRPLSDDPVLHACVLTYVSDIGGGFGDGSVPGVGRGGPSIDHAIWFHQSLRMDDWVLLETWPLKALGGRGLYMGTIQDRQGRVGAAMTQEMLLHAPVPHPPGQPEPGRH